MTVNNLSLFFFFFLFFSFFSFCLFLHQSNDKKAPHPHIDQLLFVFSSSHNWNS